MMMIHYWFHIDRFFWNFDAWCSGRRVACISHLHEKRSHLNISLILNQRLLSARRYHCFQRELPAVFRVRWVYILYNAAANTLTMHCIDSFPHFIVQQPSVTSSQRDVTLVEMPAPFCSEITHDTTNLKFSFNPFNLDSTESPISSIHDCTLLLLNTLPFNVLKITFFTTSLTSSCISVKSYAYGHECSVLLPSIVLLFHERIYPAIAITLDRPKKLSSWRQGYETVKQERNPFENPWRLEVRCSRHPPGSWDDVHLYVQ